MWLSPECLDKSGGCPCICQWHECENADSSAKDRRWTADCRLDHSGKLCVSSRKSPVNFRPVSAACSPAETAVAAASSTEHRQPEQRVKDRQAAARCVCGAVGQTIRIKSGTVSKELYIFFGCAL